MPSNASPIHLLQYFHEGILLDVILVILSDIEYFFQQNGITGQFMNFKLIHWKKCKENKNTGISSTGEQRNIYIITL